MPASGEPSTTKRLRTDPSSQQTAPPITTPWEASLCKVTATLATLPTLHESQKTYLMTAHHEFISLQKKLKNFQNRLNEVNVENYVPRSAKFNFELNCSNQLYSEQQAKVDELRQACSMAILLAQEKLRKQVAELIKLEITSVKSRVEKLFATTVVTTANTIAMIDPDIQETDAAKIYRTVFDHTDATSLLRHSTMSSSQRLYDVIFHLGKDSAATTPAASDATSSTQTSDVSTTSGSQPYRPATQSQSQDDSLLSKPYVTIFKTAIQAIFVDSWTTYTTSEAHLQNLKSVQLYLESARAATASGATAMDVDELQLPSNNNVETIVNRAVDEKTKSLQTEISRLRQQITSKNVHRGASTTSASSKKKKVTFQDPTAARTGGRQAAGSDNVSKRGKASLKKRTPRSNKNKRNSKKTGRN